MAEKTQWNKIDMSKSSAPVLKAIESVDEAFTKLEAALEASAKKKGLLPDGQKVKAIQARGGGYIFAYVDPRGPSSGPIAL